MSARDPDTGAALSDQELRDEVVSFLVAGHETTALALSWTWHLLAQNPSSERELIAEVSQVLKGRRPTPADCARLSFTKSCFLEAMRLFPPTYIKVNSTVRDDTVGGFLIPAGSIAVVSPYLTHRHPEIWPEPHTYRPERFLEGSHGPFDFLPFGAGPHVCIGKYFATMEAQLILSLVAQRFRLENCSSRPADAEALVLLRPRGDLPMRVRRRRG